MDRITQAIILAGGKGTRLQSVVQELPKPMAPIGSFPFLFYQLSYLREQGIEKVVLSVGYKKECIIDYFGHSFKGMEILYCIEDTPLGTGGAIQKSMTLIEGDVLVFNGDTFFPINLTSFYLFHKQHRADLSIALKKITHSDRYGTVNLKDNFIIGFEEKKYMESGWINGGIYCCNTNIFRTHSLPSVFSFEIDFLQKYLRELTICGPVFENYFIDIGIPEDYQLAQKTIPSHFRPELANLDFNREWTLFLDRDGVINKHLPQAYVTSIDEFEFIPGSIEAIAKMSKIFGRIVVVTNQQGIGKGMMTAMDLEKIHFYMQEEIVKQGGRLDAIYYCPFLSSIKPKCRKPDIGMALQAKEEFPEIDFSKSVMVGDSPSDMEFGKNFGAVTVFISKEAVNQNQSDFVFPSLKDFSNLL